MEQDDFRRLLQTSRKAGSSSNGFSKPKTSKVLDASQPAFKPRKLKKDTLEGPYRDRAAERREGLGGDYAQVESVLEDFEKRSTGQDKATASSVDDQRRYLGGDADHTVLVKGLDMALLEQNRARAAMGIDGVEDDDSLEQAFAESQAPKIRKREDLIRELKAKRSGKTSQGSGEEEAKKDKTREEEARTLEEGKRAGKFRPIGFTPIGGTEKKKAKDSEAKGEKKRRKKKRIEETNDVPKPIVNDPTTSTPVIPDATPTPTPITPPLPIADPQPELPDDFDIFADAGDYEGIQIDSDSDDEGEVHHPAERDHEPGEIAKSGAVRKWIDTGSPEPEPEPEKAKLLDSVLKSTSTAEATIPSPPEREEGEEEERPMRLAPLASSALPSIKDFLAADEAVSGSKKWRKKKSGAAEGKNGDLEATKGGGKKRAAEAKADRDYKRLKSYTEKAT